MYHTKYLRLQRACCTNRRAPLHWYINILYHTGGCMSDSNSPFILHSPFPIAGGQNDAIETLAAARPSKSLLVGVTGSGKTFTMANIIARQDKPVLILAPNKTLAAQLYEEFSLFFPDNKVCYFVSYYDYYQPESYLPAQDIYIPKETKINDELDRLRIEATASIINRPDTIVISSVSSIYSLGNPTDYRDLALRYHKGQNIKRADLIKQLIAIQYKRNEVSKEPGTFQVLGNTIHVLLPYQKDTLRIEMFGDTIEAFSLVGRQDHRVLMQLDSVVIFPAKHFVTPADRKEAALASIRSELEGYKHTLTNPLYRERIIKRVEHDLEMLDQVGYVSGVENYTIHFDGRKSGERPYCLFDFFPKDFLLIIDESHIAIPQLRGMYAGDKARKKALIEYGFRLPSAYDNRPLMFSEIEQFFSNTLFVSATPGDYEVQNADVVAEQIIRPTGLLDPEIAIHPRIGQMEHLVNQIRTTAKNGFRSLVMVMTKKLAEELARYLEEQKISTCYLHSDLKTPQRTELLHKLRLGVFDCLVGVNLLREGIDLPEVALVAIMDADIESFLRDKRSLIQIIGRAARNSESRVILYGDTVTRSMRAAIEETDRRRAIQQAYNEEHHITPTTVQREVTKSISNIQEAIAQASLKKKPKKAQEAQANAALSKEERMKKRLVLEQEMQKASQALRFEEAIALRAEWLALGDE